MISFGLFALQNFGMRLLKTLGTFKEKEVRS